eukprot:2831024-Karenia_brevis.AAC.1
MVVNANVLEVIKAASLACHSAAGVIVNSRKTMEVGSAGAVALAEAARMMRSAEALSCLLYTSDAADDM